MNRFYGLDLGDAESAVSRLNAQDQTTPEMLPVKDQKSFITAYARTMGGELLIGEEACYASDVTARRLRFKSRFLTDPDAERDIQAFAAGILGELYGNGDLVQNEDCCFYIGCPAGWNKNVRERYREIFERVGFPPVKIISESRAALISAVHSKHLQLSYDILSKPVLVVDIGSSTTDFAYIAGGHEVELKTGGEVMLGGGVMDEMLLDICVENSRQRDKLERTFAESDPWKTYCEFAARRLKEQYFADEAYWADHACTKTVTVLYHGRSKLNMQMDAAIAHRLLEGASSHLGGRSFRQVFTESLKTARQGAAEGLPELIFLTGGVSKIPAIAAWCREVFPEAVVITAAEPEFSVSRGLAWCGKTDEELQLFKKDIEELRSSSVVEDIVRAHIDELYKKAVDTLVEPILENAALPVFDRFRNGEIERLSDIDAVLQKEIEKYLRSDEVGELLVRPVTAWMKPVSSEIEKHTVPICIRHNVPYQAMSLTSYLSYQEIQIQLDAKKVFAVEEMTWLMNTIVSVLIGLLCGGGGIALISSGITGILSGAAISLLVLLLGKKAIQKAFLDAKIPKPIRKLIPKGYFKGRIHTITKEVKEKLMATLETDKNDEITERLGREISEQIDSFLTRMAEVVEIPLG
ncbi:MAG: Hsp70 family protein [Firmicutes bacterium]|nr:Hsp70 family protein [Bacillota bacterium]